MNAAIECVVKQCITCLEYQQMQPEGNVLHYEIPSRPWKVVGTDVFVINNKLSFAL